MGVPFEALLPAAIIVTVRHTTLPTLNTSLLTLEPKDVCDHRRWSLHIEILPERGEAREAFRRSVG